MPTAFDRSTPSADHSPLQNQMGFDPAKPTLDIFTLIEQWLSSIEEFVFPLIKDLTGIDLSSPEAFLGSIVAIILNGGTSVANFIQAIVQPIVDFIVNGLTGGSGTGNPLQILQPVLAGLAGVVETAINSANQATDIARQMMALVMQVVQGLDDLPVIGDFIDAVQGFAFWILGWFGITQQSVTDTNPAVAAANGRIAALESINTVGLEGFADHFNRPALGADWADITPYAPLEIVGGAYVKSTTRKASRYTAKTLVTDTWHVQAAVGLDHGNSTMFASCAPGAADSGTGNGVCLLLQHENFFVGPFPTGSRDTFRLYSMSGGLLNGTLRRQVVIDGGNVKSGDVIAIEYWEDVNTFYVFLNNNELTGLQWIDSGNVVDHGVGNREVILMTGSADNVFAPGSYWDDLSAYDIKVT